MTNNENKEVTKMKSNFLIPNISSIVLFYFLDLKKQLHIAKIKITEFFELVKNTKVSSISLTTKG